MKTYRNRVNGTRLDLVRSETSNTGDILCSPEHRITQVLPQNLRMKFSLCLTSTVVKIVI